MRGVRRARVCSKEGGCTNCIFLEIMLCCFLRFSFYFFSIMVVLCWDPLLLPGDSQNITYKCKSKTHRIAKETNCTEIESSSFFFFKVLEETSMSWKME